jgi:hydroxymethylglutaryl-CoA reductase
MSLPSSFRKLSIQDRRQELIRRHALSEREEQFIGATVDTITFADVMVESAVGVLPVPLGVATGFSIDGEATDVPLATEEPSVIAAASYGARIIRAGGGFESDADEPVMALQIALTDVPGTDTPVLGADEAELRERVEEQVPRMVARGGGYRGCSLSRLPESGLVRVQVYVDVRDAMGANALNSVGEQIAPFLQERLGGQVLMAILSNAATNRCARASFRLPLERLRTRHLPPEELARRIVAANNFAHDDQERAVTHNKGIMNGVEALALATGNDTRAVSAACHRYAARHGTYRALTEYRIEGNALVGRLELPLALGTVGGSVGVNPASSVALRILGSPDTRRLARIACCLGLAQNFAALRALVSEGIQQGHMKLHARRLAWQAGATAEELDRVAQELVDAQQYSLDAVESALAELRREDPNAAEPGMDERSSDAGAATTDNRSRTAEEISNGVGETSRSSR